MFLSPLNCARRAEPKSSNLFRIMKYWYFKSKFTNEEIEDWRGLFQSHTVANGRIRINIIQSSYREKEALPNALL